MRHSIWALLHPVSLSLGLLILLVGASLVPAAGSQSLPSAFHDDAFAGHYAGPHVRAAAAAAIVAIAAIVAWHELDQPPNSTTKFNYQYPRAPKKRRCLCSRAGRGSGTPYRQAEKLNGRGPALYPPSVLLMHSEVRPLATHDLPLITSFGHFAGSTILGERRRLSVF